MALQLTPAGYQKVLAAQSKMRRPTTTQQPAQQAPASTRPKAPSGGASPELGITKAGLGLSQQIAKFLEAGKGTQAAIGGLQSAAQIAGGAQQLAQGRTVPGALGIAGGLASGLSNPALAGQVGQALGLAPSTASMLPGVGGTAGGLLGLAGLGYGLSQGQGDPSMIGSALSAGGQALSGLGSIGASQAASGSTGALASASPALSAAGSTIGLVGAGVGATWAAGQSVHSLASALDSGDDRQLGSGIGSVTGLAAGLVIGTMIAPGIGTLIGAGLGAAAGGALGGLFGQNKPSYIAVREHARDVGNLESLEYRTMLEQALNSGDVNQVQSALSQAQGNNRVRIDLDLPSDVAAAVGVPEKLSNEDIGRMAPDQFLRLLKAWRERQGVTQGWLVGSGDIPNLPGAQAEALAKRTSAMGAKTLDIVSEGLGAQLDAMPPVAPLTWEEIGEYRLAPQLEYSEYIHTPEQGLRPQDTPYHQRNIPYERVRQLAEAGQLGPRYSVRGLRLAEAVEGTPGLSGGRTFAAPTFTKESEKARIAQERTGFEAELARLRQAAQEEAERRAVMEQMSSGYGFGA